MIGRGSGVLAGGCARTGACRVQAWLDRELLDTEALCGHLVADGSVYSFLAAHPRRLFPDEFFADLFPSGRGRPSVPAEVIASAFVLKELEGLSDRQAAAALTRDIAWKVACGLASDAEGFDASVFVLFCFTVR